MTAPTRPGWRPNAAYVFGLLLEPDVLMFYYRATTAGTSGATEPVWPLVNGATVTDGTVVWTAYTANTITWTAQALNQSGGAQPAWPTTMGATIVDNGVTWTTRSAAISDVKCPQSKIALKIAEKIYSPYRDVLRYCVTNNPRDWTTADDAGFLPTGLQSSGSPEVTALGEYRGRLAAWTGSDLEIWTVDPDPAEMSLFDNIAGLGTSYAKAVAPVAGDLLFLTTRGVRSLSVAAGATNLSAGDVGTVIDPLIRAKLAQPGVEPIATYYPGSGQFWLIFSDEVFVYSRTTAGKLGTWSRYLYPFTIDATLQLNNDLYFRSGNTFYRVDEDAIDDGGVQFEGVIWTPYMGMGNDATTKLVDSFDVTAYGTCEVSFGTDQVSTTVYTTPVLVGPDTITGGRIPMPIAAPSIAVKIRFLPGQSWQLNSFNLYVNDMKPGL